MPTVGHEATDLNVFEDSFCTLPIKTAKDLSSYARRFATSHHLTPKQLKRTNSTKLLVCHDMKGNYLNDNFRFNSGSVYDNAFDITDWELVDIFCYFSHHLISIPPLSWIYSCNRHGSLVMGTFITEWEEGERNCAVLFASPDAAISTACAMIDIALDYGIDGWLINIENALSLELIANVKIFLRTLTKRMRAQCGSRAKVIWYDAVTSAGRLQWQDALTELNKPFFDDCDGIFINYTWRPETVCKTWETLGAVNSPSRAREVFYGIDVFGRGSVGGGGFNCGEALRALSAAHPTPSSGFDTAASDHGAGTVPADDTSGDTAAGDAVTETRHIANQSTNGRRTREGVTESMFSVALFAPGWVLETQLDVPTAHIGGSAYNRYPAVHGQLKHKMKRFWQSIRDSWYCDGSPNTYTLPRSRGELVGPAAPTDTKLDLHWGYTGYSFSAASGNCVFLNGKPFRHWATADLSLQALQTHTSQMPFYDLSLQDMRWGIVNTRGSGDEGLLWDIELCDAVGWEGTSSLRMCLVSDHGQSDGNVLSSQLFVEIPLVGLASAGGLTTGPVKHTADDCIYVSVFKYQTGRAHSALRVHMQVADALLEEPRVPVEVLLLDGALKLVDHDKSAVPLMFSPIVEELHMGNDGATWMHLLYEICVSDILGAVLANDTTSFKEDTFEVPRECLCIMQRITIVPVAGHSNDSSNILPCEEDAAYIGSVAVCCARGPLVKSALRRLSAETSVPDLGDDVIVTGLCVVDALDCIDGRVGVTLQWDECIHRIAADSVSLQWPLEGVSLFSLPPTVLSHVHDKLHSVISTSEWKDHSEADLALLASDHVMYGVIDISGNTLFGSLWPSVSCNSDIALMGTTRARAFRLNILPNMGHRTSFQTTTRDAMQLQVSCITYPLIMQPYNLLTRRPDLSLCPVLVIYALRRHTIPLGSAAV